MIRIWLNLGEKGKERKENEEEGLVRLEKAGSRESATESRNIIYSQLYVRTYGNLPHVQQGIGPSRAAAQKGSHRPE